MVSPEFGVPEFRNSEEAVFFRSNQCLILYVFLATIWVGERDFLWGWKVGESRRKPPNNRVYPLSFNFFGCSS